MIGTLDRQNVRLYLRLSLLLGIEFVVIYGGANWLTQYRTDVHRIYFDRELLIPMVPAMVWVYASIAVLMVLPVFYLDGARMRRLARQVALAMLIAGIVFLVYPGQAGYAPVADLPAGIGLLKRVDLPYNVMPSLHVALSAIIARALYPGLGAPGRIALVAWLAAMIASVLLTHQHHVADVLAAAVLAWLCLRLVPGNAAAARAED